VDNKLIEDFERDLRGSYLSAYDRDRGWAGGELTEGVGEVEKKGLSWV
jgi:hypothetical protein